MNSIHAGPNDMQIQVQFNSVLTEVVLENARIKSDSLNFFLLKQVVSEALGLTYSATLRFRYLFDDTSFTIESTDTLHTYLDRVFENSYEQSLPLRVDWLTEQVIVFVVVVFVVVVIPASSSGDSHRTHDAHVAPALCRQQPSSRPRERRSTGVACRRLFAYFLSRHLITCLNNVGAALCRVQPAG
jgi:hypothetical protein